MKTNALRLLEAAAINHVVHPYPIDDGHLDATEVAALIRVEAERVFKTLVLVDDSGANLLAVIPGPCELNLKKTAKAFGSRKVDLIRLADLTSITGYVRGGCTALGTKKPLPVLLDETAQLFEHIVVSAGLRGLQMELKPDDLLKACLGTGCPLARYADLI